MGQDIIVNCNRYIYIIPKKGETLFWIIVLFHPVPFVYLNDTGYFFSVLDLALRQLDDVGCNPAVEYDKLPPYSMPNTKKAH